MLNKTNRKAQREVAQSIATAITAVERLCEAAKFNNLEVVMLATLLLKRTAANFQKETGESSDLLLRIAYELLMDETESDEEDA